MWSNLIHEVFMIIKSYDFIFYFSFFLFLLYIMRKYLIDVVLI